MLTPTAALAEAGPMEQMDAHSKRVTELRALGPSVLLARWQGHVGSELAAANEANQARAQLGWFFDQLPLLHGAPPEGVRPAPVNGEVTRRMLNRAVNDGYFMFVQKGRRKADLDLRWWSVLWCALTSLSGLVAPDKRPLTDEATRDVIQDSIVELIGQIVQIQNQEMTNTYDDDSSAHRKGARSPSGVSEVDSANEDLDQDELNRVVELVKRDWLSKKRSPVEQTLGELLISESLRIVRRADSRRRFLAQLEEEINELRPNQGVDDEPTGDEDAEASDAFVSTFTPRAKGTEREGTLNAAPFADLLDRLGSVASNAEGVGLVTRYHTGVMLRYMAWYIRDVYRPSGNIHLSEINILLNKLQAAT